MIAVAEQLLLLQSEDMLPLNYNGHADQKKKKNYNGQFTSRVLIFFTPHQD